MFDTWKCTHFELLWPKARLGVSDSTAFKITQTMSRTKMLLVLDLNLKMTGGNWCFHVYLIKSYAYCASLGADVPGNQSHCTTFLNTKTISRSMGLLVLELNYEMTYCKLLHSAGSIKTSIFCTFIANADWGLSHRHSTSFKIVQTMSSQWWLLF